jgi:hypothetical protein
VFDDSELDFVTLVLEEHVHHLEEVLLSQALSQQLRYFMQTFTQGLLDSLIVGLE